MQDRYIYENKLTECPHCGASLNEMDKECPYCLANLVGYNEKTNRITNLNQSANDLEEIAKKRDEIRRNQIKENKKKEKASKKVSIILMSVFGIFMLFAFLIGYGDDISNLKYTSEYKTYEEVKEQFLNIENLPTIKVTNVQNIDGELKKDGNDKLEGDWVNRYSYKMEYNQKERKTIIKHIYNDTENKYTFKYIYDVNEVFVPEVDLFLGEISYDGNKVPVDYSGEFKELYDNMNLDEYILVHYAENDKNLLEKYGYLEIEQENDEPIIFTLYLQNRQNENNRSRLIAVTNLKDDLIYEMVINAYQMESIYEIIDKPQKYFQIAYDKNWVANLD